MSSPFSIALTGQSLIRHDLRTISDPRLHDIAQILKASDVAFTNLETTIYGRYGGWPPRAHTSAPPHLRFYQL